jgi:hypothetical protein
VRAQKFFLRALAVKFSKQRAAKAESTSLVSSAASGAIGYIQCAMGASVVSTEECAHNRICSTRKQEGKGGGV